MMTRKIIAMLAGIALIGMAPLAAQEADKMDRSTIQVTGESTVQARPDQAELSLGVTTQAASGQAAASQNARKVDAVLGALRKALGSSAEIKTLSYSLSPDYRYPKEGGQPTIAGYTASNIVQVKVSDLAQVGNAIDAATQSGANQVQSLRFTLKDEQAAQTQALREAATRAKAKSDALASALGVKVARILRVDEGGQPPRPIYAEAMAMRAKDMAAVSTPVEAGTIEIHATVSLTVEIAR